MTKPSNKARVEMAIKLGDLSDLPEQLRSQLTALKRPDKSGFVLDAIDASKNGAATVNDMLIAIWRKHQTVWRRRDLHQLLYRMKRDGLIELVSTGTYRCRSEPKRAAK